MILVGSSLVPPNPKFVILSSLRCTTFGFARDTSNFMILVRFWI